MSTELLSRLDDWARERQIWPKEFHCPHYEECNKEALHLERGYTCGMSYVGQEYGEPELAPGKPFRLVIVGIDPGANYEEKKLEGFIESQKGIETWYYGTETKFNQHYRGVIRTAAAVLGRDGKHCLEHCYQESKCVGGRKRPNGKRCVLRSFVQPNLVKCAGGPDRQTRSGAVMLKNCPQYLVSELEVLKPDLIVFHGAKAQWAFPNVLPEGYDSVPLPDSPKQGNFSVIQKLTTADLGSECFILYLHHPSHGCLNRQWGRVVEPALKLLRSKGAIPPL